MGIRGQFTEKSLHTLHLLFLGKPLSEKTDRPDIATEMLGALRMIYTSVGRASLTNEGNQGRAGNGGYCFLLQRSGAGELQQYGQRARLTCGDLALYDPSCMWRYQAEEDGAVILMHVPSRLLSETLPEPESLCGRRLGCNDGLTATVGAMAATLIEQLRYGLDDISRQRAANHLLGMLASCYAPAIECASSGSAVMSGRLWRVKGFIEENLRHPKLSPAMVAAEMKLSPRYLRMIFAASDESILAYIMRRRLEECARQLADPRWRGHSITEIAFGWGFNSAPHFTRSFREQFGVSPRQHRQRGLDSSERMAA